MTELTTPRLLLRRWRDTDREPYAALNADPEVMVNFPSLLTREQSDAMIDKFENGFEQYGFGLWAVEVRETGQFIGFTGIQWVPFDAPFAPAVEIGWRMARAAWGHGYATEAARASATHGFATGLTEIVAMVVPQNLRSQAVMHRLGMTRDPEADFEHPRIEPGHPLAKHYLFRLRAEDFSG